MVGSSKTHTHDTYKLYNPETERVVMIREINQEEWKNTDPEKTMKMFLDLNENYLVTCIQEVGEQVTTPTSDIEDPLPVHVIPDEG